MEPMAENRSDFTARKFETLKKKVLAQDMPLSPSPSKPSGLSVPPPDVSEVMLRILNNQMVIMHAMMNGRFKLPQTVHGILNGSIAATDGLMKRMQGR